MILSLSKIVYVRMSAPESRLIKLKTGAYLAIGDAVKDAVREAVEDEKCKADGELALSSTSYLTSAATVICTRDSIVIHSRSCGIEKIAFKIF